MKESFVLYFSSTKMAGHRQVLKRQGLNLYSHIKDTLRGAENSIWWSREDTIAWSHLKIATNSECCTTSMLNLNIKLTLIRRFTELSVYNSLLYSQYESIACLSLKPLIQSFDSITAEGKWTNLTRVMLSKSSVHRYLTILNSTDDTLDVWYNMLMTCS